MRLQQEIDFTTLNWVKQELDETLRQARQALEAYAEDTADSSLMRFCATYLHQVQGTLRMVELYGAAMVVEEMERVAQALLDGQIRNKDDAFEALLRGTVQLPDYLERLQSGHKDIPIVLLPLLNDLRACRGEKLLSEGVLFTPDLTVAIPASVRGPERPLADAELRTVAGRLRLNYQAGLVKFLRDQTSSLAITGMLNALDGLGSISAQEDARRLWWVASGLLESIRAGGVDANAAVKLLFGRIDREIKRFVDVGEVGFRAEPPKEMLKNLLYYIAQSKGTDARTAEIRKIYRLDQLVASEQEIEQARDALVGRNRAVLDTVSTAIKEDLMRVKDALDLFLRTANANASDLSPQVEVLDRVGDTLGVLGLGVPRRVVLEQRESLNKMVTGQRVVEEGALLDVAGALLFVEASLDDNIERLGGADLDSSAADAAPEANLELPQAEVRKILDSLMKEVQTNLQQIKQDVVAFIESGWDHAKAEQIPRLLDEVSGAMTMVNLGEASSLLNAISKFIDVELLRRKRVPTADQMDRLADAVASMEFYLEATHAQRVGRERILEVTRDSLASLGYWPVPADTMPIAVAPAREPVARPAAPAPAAVVEAPVAPKVEPTPMAAPVAAESPKQAPVVLELAPVAPIAEESLDLSALTFGIETTETKSKSQDRFREQEMSDASLPSLDLPGAESIDEFVAKLGSADSHQMIVEEPAPAPVVAAPEMRSVVEIAPGQGLEGLIVGEPAAMPVSEVAEQDLKGLKLAQTESFAAPEPEEEFDYEWVEIEQEVIDEPVAVEGGAFQSVPSDDIDEEIREVFLEEVQEEVENLGRCLPDWKNTPNDFEKLKPIRRSFHTMKGSGRLVGAMALGEFSWKVENMLNRVLDKSITPGPAVIALLDQAVAALPFLLAALRGEKTAGADVAGIMEVAEKLAAGEEAWLRPAEPVRRIEKVRVQIKKPRPPRQVSPVVEAPVELTEALDILEPVIETRAEPEIDSFVDVGAYSVEVEPEAEVVMESAAPAMVASTQPGSGYDHYAATDGLHAAVDPMMLEILRSEVAGHLNTVSAYLDSCARAGHAQPVTEELLRAVHTMHGAIAMVEIPSLSPLLGPLEGYVKRLRGAGAAPSQNGLHAIVDAAAAIEAEIAAVDQPNAVRVNTAQLVERLSGLRNELPEPESFAEVFNLVVAEDEAAEPATQSSHELHFDELDFAAPQEGAGVVEPELQPEIEVASGLDDAALDFSFVEESPILADEDLTAPALSDDFNATVELETPVERPAFESLEDWNIESAFEDEVPAEPVQTAPLESVDSLPAAADRHETADAMDMSSLDALFAETERMERLEADAQPESVAAADELSQGISFAELSDSDVALFRSEEAELAAPVKADDSVSAVSAPAAALAPGSGAEHDNAERGNYQAIADDSSPDGPLDVADMDEDLLEIFVQEANDILDNSDTMMARLREAPEEREIVIGLQRELHTLKGGARMAGLAPIGDLGHAMESLLEIVADGRREIDRVGLESLERGFDRLHSLVARVAKRQAIGMPSNAIARFEALAAGDEIPFFAMESKVAEEGHAPVAEAAAAETAAPAAEAAPTPRVLKPTARDLAAEEGEEFARPQQEMIRVRADLLDNLVNYAGEVSIYRSRLEQQMSTFRFNLQELDQTVLRLREQLRKLEIETEAQIIARYQREAEASEGEFDPLELDRFSTLQQLSRALAESASDLVALQGTMDDLTRQSETLLLQQSRVSSELQEGLMRTRMVPFDSVVPRLRRLMRQTSGELGKRAQLRVEGAQGEMDRNVLDRMTAPLEHMLRNALAHGLETPNERSAAGKAEEGTVTIGISREATEVVIRVTDDGKGMDRDAIRRKALERGLMKPDVQLSDRDLFGFVLETGFSTAESVSKIAGRGVGMDVVNSEIKQLGGSLTIDSKRGIGSEFTVRLPFTLAVTQAILVRLGEHLFAVPMSSVQGVARIKREDLDERLKSHEPVYSYGGDDYAIYELSDLLGYQQHRASDDDQLPLLMTKSGDQRAAIRVDAVLGSREVVVKSVGPQISSVPGIFGATIMGDGSVVMILDMAPLVRRSAALKRTADSGLVDGEFVPPPAPIEVRRQPLIMVVDDSITMRKVTSRVLERNDMEVATAKDGLDAVEKLQDKIPDLVLLDIEMPRMDGYELATYMRNDPRLKTVPIIMITSRTGEKHRQRAFEIGVDRYLGKPYQEADLLQNVEEILRLSRAIH
jgi:chemosensory pili system protein ChpA (sensor histidine kinase/response regulator)